MDKKFNEIISQILLLIFTGFFLTSGGYSIYISQSFYIPIIGIYSLFLITCYKRTKSLNYVLYIVKNTLKIVVIFNIIFLVYLIFFDNSVSSLDSIIFTCSDMLIITREYTTDQIYKGALLYCQKNNYNISIEDIRNICDSSKDFEEVKLKLNAFNLKMQEVRSSIWENSYICGGIGVVVIVIISIGGYFAYSYLSGPTLPENILISADQIMVKNGDDLPDTPLSGVVDYVMDDNIRIATEVDDLHFKVDTAIAELKAQFDNDMEAFKEEVAEEFVKPMKLIDEVWLKVRQLRTQNIISRRYRYI